VVEDGEGGVEGLDGVGGALRGLGVWRGELGDPEGNPDVICIPGHLRGVWREVWREGKK
jgi:hypothetical protein